MKTKTKTKGQSVKTLSKKNQEEDSISFSLLHVLPVLGGAVLLSACGGGGSDSSTALIQVTQPPAITQPVSPPPVIVAPKNNIILAGAISAHTPYNFNITPGDSKLPTWIQDDAGTEYIIQNMKSVGMNTVTLHFNYSLDPKTDTFFRPTFETMALSLASPDWNTIEAGAVRVTNAGMKPVFYMTVLQLPYSWDSLLASKYEPRNPNAFFVSYKEQIMKIAALSEKYDSPYMSIGVELGPVATEGKYLPFWKDLISDVRKVYHGKISYSSHVDDKFGYNTELDDITFKNDIDLLGMNFYPSTLNDGRLDGTYNEFYAEWKADVVPQLQSLIKKLDKPVFISEFGVTRIDGTGSNGFWGNDTGMKLDFTEQSEVFDAAFKAMHEGLDLEGIVIWGASDSIDLIDGTFDVNKSYTNNWIDVPAEPIVAKWFYEFTHTYPFG